MTSPAILFICLSRAVQARMPGFIPFHILGYTREIKTAYALSVSLKSDIGFSSFCFC